MQLTDLSWPRVESLSKDTPIVFPVAALEQHSHHLPLFTDSLLLGEIIRRAAEPLAERVVFAPLLWLGNSDHHLDFPGTLSAPPRAYLDVLNGLLENFVQHGFRRLVFINGHGGNIVPGEQTVFEARQRHRRRNDLLLLFATYWRLGGQPHLADPSLRQQQMGHACEWETSMMLRITPQLVGDFKAANPTSPANIFEPATRGWVTQDRSVAGHIGDPGPATPEKGETLLRTFSDDVIRLLELVIAWNGTDWSGSPPSG